MMKILVNGKNREFKSLESLAELLESLELKAASVVVEHNERVIARDCLASTPVSDGDKIEIVHFIGGG